MQTPPMHTLITKKEIEERVAELGQQITKDYAPGPLVLVGVLKGACFFLADLARQIDLPVKLDFVGLASYGSGKSSSGEVKLTKDLDMAIEGSDVLVVEDIVDMGITLTYLLDLLRQRQPASLRVAALLDKKERRVKEVPVAYTGFEIPNEFVVGYGMDFADLYRNLKEIRVLEEPPVPPAEETPRKEAPSPPNG